MEESTKSHLPADKSVVAVFRNMEAAERAHALVKDLGYPEDQINVLMSDEARLQYFNAPDMQVEVIGATSTGGPAMGAAVGTGAGALLGGSLAAAAVLALPGIGLVALGPLAAMLAGAGFGGLAGGMVGSLVGVGVTPDRAKTYEEKIQQGNIIIGIDPRSPEEAQQIIAAWNQEGGEIIAQAAP